MLRKRILKNHTFVGGCPAVLCPKICLSDSQIHKTWKPNYLKLQRSKKTPPGKSSLQVDFKRLFSWSESCPSAIFLEAAPKNSILHDLGS